MEYGRLKCLVQLLYPGVLIGLYVYGTLRLANAFIPCMDIRLLFVACIFMAKSKLTDIYVKSKYCSYCFKELG